MKAGSKTQIKRFILNTIKTLVLPVAVIVLFAIITEGRSLNARTLLVTMRQSVIPILISMALISNMLMGIMDFSVGAAVLASAIIGGNLMNLTNTGIPGLVLFCMLTGVLLASLTGFLNNKLKIPTFVLALGLLLVYEALPRMIFNGGATIRMKYTTLALSPWIFIVLAIMFILYYVLFNLTTYGHNIRALGGNEDIAKSAGLNDTRIKQIAFSISGIFIGVAAVLHMSTNGQILNVAMFGSMGTMFDAFMGVILAFFLAKYCNIAVAVVVGTFTMNVLANNLVAAGMGAMTRQVMTGVFLLILLGISSNQERFTQWRLNRERAKAIEKKYKKETI